MAEDIDTEADDPVFAAGFDDEDSEEADIAIEPDDEGQPRQGSD